MLTPDQLGRIMPNLPAAKAALFLPPLNAAMAEFGIATMLRTAAFIAQLAHESGEFRWMEEIWGPTDAQRRYEPPSDLAKRLGNTQAGDGKRFKGRGPIQLTGRANYEKFGGLLGLDLTAAPEQATTPEVAFRIAGLYWKSRGLNELADAEDFKEITRRINGGFNGLADRQKYYERAKAVLAEGFMAEPATRSTRAAKPAAKAVPADLMRGAEVMPAAKKTAAKKAPAKVAPAKKAPAKKTVAKKAPAKKTPAKKTAARKVAR